MERHKIPMLAQMYASEQRPIGFDQKDMMRSNRGLYEKGRNRAAICEGECHDRLVSNATERSKEARREMFTSSRERRRSFTIFRRAVSVECPGRSIS